MKKTLIKICTVLFSVMLLLGCTPKNTLPVADPNQDDNLAGIILKGADQAKNINLADVEKIELYDLEGNSIEYAINKEDVVSAFNASMIDDTGYVKMLAGRIMVIFLKDDKKLTLTSYGDATKIIATTENLTYHLISPELAAILLD